jgi:TorA maturation chaperone TorD
VSLRPDGPFRADVCAQLSECFKPPDTAFCAAVASGALRDFLGAACQALKIHAPALLAGLTTCREEPPALAQAYRRLFEGPLPPYVVPVESVYKRWTTDPACRLSMAGDTGYLMGDPAMDMIARYRARRMRIPDRYVSMPDHIALELEYLAILFTDGDAAAPREFVARHLDWARDLAREIREAPGADRFYVAVSEITALVLQRLSPGAFRAAPARVPALDGLPSLG